MSISETISKVDGFLRPRLSLLPPKLYIYIYSRGRKYFLDTLTSDKLLYFDPHWIKPLNVWGIKFNNRLFNAAGMFKSGKGYRMSAKSGAGAWLAGTTTSKQRSGNEKNGIVHPFVSLPRSKSAINWLGLPNRGHKQLAVIISNIEKIDGCPIGVSLSSDPSENGLTALNSLVEGFQDYEKSGVDFIELNESCPNVVGHSHKNNNDLDNEMINRLEYLKDNFLKKRKRNLPVIVKYSNDTDPILLPKLIPLLIDLGFDGINLGNTSTRYNFFLKDIDITEKELFNYFTSNFGGGLSGKILKENSLNLCKTASGIITEANPKSEFHIIRTGGIESYQDLKESDNAGVTLNQWYSGYFENFSKFGHLTYKKIITNFDNK